MLDWLRFILTAGLLISGLIILITAVMGVYKLPETRPLRRTRSLVSIESRTSGCSADKASTSGGKME